MAIVSIGAKASLGTLQRLSQLLPSLASPDQKLEAAALAADSLTQGIVADTKKGDQKKKLQLA